MNIIIDSRHVVRADGFKWTIHISSGKGKSARPKIIDCGCIRDLFDSLRFHRLIDPSTPNADRQASKVATAIQQQLQREGRSSFTFANGRFEVEPGIGDLHLLLNPTQDVSRLPLDKDRRSRRTVVAFCPSIESALLTALERTLQKDSRTIPLKQFASVVNATAQQLWKELRTK